jgi:hypothetical protein
MISLPVPAYGVAYAVAETDKEIVVFFGLKTAGVMTAESILDRCKKLASQLEWKLYACAETGSPEGSPNAFERYTLFKEGNRVILNAAGCGDMVTAFRNVTSDRSPGAIAVDNIEQLLEELGVQKK